jgi:hypothetical protein
MIYMGGIMASSAQQSLNIPPGLANLYHELAISP